ncbi:MAG: cell division protein ZapA, partial [bacterium]
RPVSGKKSSVKVEIIGESYILRTEAAPEHTKAVAEYLDKAIRQILSGGSSIDSNRAAILAALQITSELFQSREANGALIGAMQGLSADVRRLLPPAKRDSGTTGVVTG